MLQFDSYVVRTDCVDSVDAIQSHPNVQGVIQFPEGWMLYEFHHDLFRDPDFLAETVWREKMERNPELRQARIAMLKEERNLLKPWYAGTKKIGDADAILPGGICNYYFCALNKMKWIPFDLAVGWGAAEKFTVTLEAPRPGTAGNLPRLIQEWLAAGRAALRCPAGLTPLPQGFALDIECSGKSGHWLAGLWALLSDGRWNTGVDSIRVMLHV